MLKVTSDLTGLKNLQDRLGKLSSTSQVSLFDVLTAEFVSSNSSFADFESLLAAVGVTTKEEFDALPNADFDTFVASNTKFESWLDMQKQGMNEYVRDKLLQKLKS